MAAEPVVDLTRQDLCPTVIELGSWLLESGIQAPEGHFYAWYDLERSAFVRPYPEITGYGISTLCWLFDLTGNPRLVERARRAFDFLEGDAIHPGWGLVGTQPLSILEKLDGPVSLHTFDSGIVATSLERLAMRSSDPQVGKAVERITSTFLNHLLLDDGTLWPLIDFCDGTPTSSTQRWSQSFSGYQLKSLMFLMLGGTSNGGTDEETTTRRVVERVLAEQQKCGAFPSYPTGETHLHPHLYTLEALSVAAAIHGEERWLERVAAGFKYMERLIAERGCLPTRAQKDRVTVHFERADIVAQFLRLGSYLCSAGCISRRRLDSVLLWTRRRLQQYVIEEGRHRGGVLFGQDGDGTFKQHVNCAATLMSAQACHWYESAQSRVHLDPTELV